MRVTIHNAIKKLVDSDAREVVLPGEDGELSVWDFHQSCLYSLRAGQIKLLPAGSSNNEEIKRFPLKKGLAIIRSDMVSVLIED